VDPLYAILTDPKYRHGGGNRDEFLDTGESFAAAIVEQCDALGLAKDRGRALDFGCGIGRVSAPLSHRFAEVVGLDISPSMVETARSVHGERTNCRFEVQRTTDLRQFADASFDLVLCVLVLQHLDISASSGVSWHPGERWSSSFLRESPHRLRSRRGGRGPDCARGEAPSSVPWG
jgi:SAM-dependent methyltransferase